MSQLTLNIPIEVSEKQLHDPSGYKGLYAFHKYWGKKPAETVGYLIDKLSDHNDLVIDPFMGSGAIAREAVVRGRRFIGGDINPAAYCLTSTILTPPSAEQLRKALHEVEKDVKQKVEATYKLQDGSIGSHYLWDESGLTEVWIKKIGCRTRVELKPTDHDHSLICSFSAYSAQNLRPLNTFRNSRINSPGGLDWNDFFTGRALNNLELIRDSIHCIEDQASRRALLMSLTAASGQMSRMVFAIEKRGKTAGNISSCRKEVGSWVIGFWRPKLHFEVNSWNCFVNKAKALLRGIESPGIRPIVKSSSIDNVLDGTEHCFISQSDAASLIEQCPNHSVDLIITDPPHGDRIPYLELSEIWNAILDKEVSFVDEIVVTNAPERRKTSEAYGNKLKTLFKQASRAMAQSGALAIMFNSRSRSEWSDLILATAAGGFEFAGCFPMAYSAGSVVQDNREGAMRSDYVLIFHLGSFTGANKRIEKLSKLSNWSSTVPLLDAS